MLKLIVVGGACLILAACASVPQPLKGEFASVVPRDAAQADGSHVRWGGEIVRTEPEATRTCIYALSRPLNSRARPMYKSESMGRFVACRQGFYDPEIFAKGRDITVTGTLNGTLSRKVGQYDYPYPLVEADSIYLWPVIQPLPPGGYYNPYFYDPFWGPSYWGGGPFWYPPTRVIVVPAQPVKPPPKGN